VGYQGQRPWLVSDAAMITGDFTRAEAERIAGGIQP
jgi:hypothetical protein